MTGFFLAFSLLHTACLVSISQALGLQVLWFARIPAFPLTCSCLCLISVGRNLLYLSFISLHGAFSESEAIFIGSPALYVSCLAKALVTAFSSPSLYILSCLLFLAGHIQYSFWVSLLTIFSCDYLIASYGLEYVLLNMEDLNLFKNT